MQCFEIEVSNIKINFTTPKQNYTIIKCTEI